MLHTYACLAKHLNDNSNYIIEFSFPRNRKRSGPFRNAATAERVHNIYELAILEGDMKPSHYSPTKLGQLTGSRQRTIMFAGNAADRRTVESD